MAREKVQNLFTADDAKAWMAAINDPNAEYPVPVVQSELARTRWELCTKAGLLGEEVSDTSRGYTRIDGKVYSVRDSEVEGATSRIVNETDGSAYRLVNIPDG